MARPPTSINSNNLRGDLARRRSSTPPRSGVSAPGGSDLPPFTRSNLSASNARAILTQIDFSSIAKTMSSLDRLRIGNDRIPGLMNEAVKQSSNKALVLTKAFLKRNVPDRLTAQATRTLILWGRGRNRSERREIIIKAFHQLKGGLFLIHFIGELPRADARAYMQEYFTSGGDMKTIVRWLQISGAAVRRLPRPIPGTDGWFGDAVDWASDQAADLGGAIVDAVDTVVDAVISAGRSVGDALADVVGWTIDRVADVIEALIAVGHTVRQIVLEIVDRSMAVIRKTLRALLHLHYTVADIIDDIADFLPGPLGTVVRALVQIGTSSLEIVVNFTNRSLSSIQTALEALLSEGQRLMVVVRDICRHVASEMRRGFFEGLIALNNSALTILVEAARSGTAIALAAFSCLLEIWGGYRGLTQPEISDARRIFGWSIDLSRVKITTASIPADVANWVNGNRPFTTMYVINFSSNSSVERGDLIHELTHVWQAVVAGPVYMVDALHSQQFGAGYVVTETDIRNANGELENLQVEQQAVVVENYWRGKYNGESYPWRTYEPLARQVYQRRYSMTLHELPISRARLAAARANLPIPVS